MNHQGRQSITRAQAGHLFALRTRQWIRLPLPGTGGEYLEGVAAQSIGALRGILHSTGCRDMDADPPRREHGRPLRRRQQLQDVFFLLGGTFSHESVILNGAHAVAAPRPVNAAIESLGRTPSPFRKSVFAPAV